MKTASLRARLILAAFLWVAVGLVAAGLVLRLSFQDSLERTFQIRLQASLRALVAAIETGPDGKLAVTRPLGDLRFDQPYGGWYWQVSGPDGILLRSRSLWDFELPVSAAPESAQIRFGQSAGPQDQTLLLAERDLTFPPLDGPVHVLVAASRADIDREIDRFMLVLLASFACLGTGLVAAVWFQAGYGLMPLTRLARELATLRSTPGGRLKSDYPTEVAPLAQALNTVLDHDSDLIDRARTHVGNLAHGLKTPLAVMAAELSSPQPDHDQMRDQLERMGRLVEHHLTRARTEATLTRVAGILVPVEPVARDIARTLSRVHAHRGLEFRVEVEAGAAFPAEAEDLAEMIGNLAENACKWATSQVVVSASADGFAIEDDGPGLSDQECAAVTDRGIRLDEAKPGHGLGLSIVADLAALYGARLMLSRSALGGLRAAVRLGQGQQGGD